MDKETIIIIQKNLDKVNEQAKESLDKCREIFLGLLQQINI